MPKLTLPADFSSPRTFPGILRNGKRKQLKFRPKRVPAVNAYKRNCYIPNRWRSEDSPLAARMFVGFSVGDKPKYKMSDLVNIVKRVRREQTGMADSSFVYQRGVYTHHDGKEVTEDAAQVLILNLNEDTNRKQFTKQMVELAETILVELEQETVIFEIQQGGTVLETFGIDQEPWT